MNQELQNLKEKAVAFHGHMCPGLALGIKAAKIGLEEFGRDGDEDIVAVVETDMCAVDAIQVLMGCTFGKGNLLFVDHGKAAFSFYRRRDGKSLRLVLNPEAKRPGYADFAALREKMRKHGESPGDAEELKRFNQQSNQAILEMDSQTLFLRKPANSNIPKRARLFTSLACAKCGEMVMESRIRLRDGEHICLACLEAERA